MLNISQIFSQPENPVLSLEVQARAVPTEVIQMNRFVVLMRHFFDRFFDNPMTSSEGEIGVRVVQIMCAIAIPGLMVAFSLIPSYFMFPPNMQPRAFWPRVGDHYFYVMYASVVMGAVTVFEWDQLFPDLIDIQVLTPLPVPARKLFNAKITALATFLGLFLFASGILGAIFLPLIAEEPSIFRHFLSHVLAVAAAGVFTAAFFIALQGILLNTIGERFFRWISPALRGLSLAALLIVLFLFPLLSQNLQLLLMSGNQYVLYFPLFWFLGLYQVLLLGNAALPVFHALAATGGWALLSITALAFLTYPLAYHRKARSTIEGTVAKSARHRFADARDAVVHALFVHKPTQRAVYHFIGKTLKRAPHHRVYLSMFGGAGLALLMATIIAFKQESGRLTLVLSERGLRSAIPVVAFLTVTGLKAAFMSPVALKANWAFYGIGIRPDGDHIASTQRWTLLRALILTTAVLLFAEIIAPEAFPGIRQLAAQLLVAQGLCLLLIDVLFLQFLSIPFTVPLVYSKRNMGFLLAAFLILFPPFILQAVDAGRWVERSYWHFPIAVLFIVGAHLALQSQQQRVIRERASLPESEDADDFPQRLGLAD
jgi:hypothetical protein